MDVDRTEAVVDVDTAMVDNDSGGGCDDDGSLRRRTGSDIILRSILSGNLTGLPTLGSRTVCVFLSSTFSGEISLFYAFLLRPY